MISNISPSNLTYEDTYNTLRYADRAKKIKINLKKNILSVDFQVIVINISIQIFNNPWLQALILTDPFCPLIILFW